MPKLLEAVLDEVFHKLLAASDTVDALPRRRPTFELESHEEGRLLFEPQGKEQGCVIATSKPINPPRLRSGRGRGLRGMELGGSSPKRAIHRYTVGGRSIDPLIGGDGPLGGESS